MLIDTTQDNLHNNKNAKIIYISELATSLDVLVVYIVAPGRVFREGGKGPLAVSQLLNLSVSQTGARRQEQADFFLNLSFQLTGKDRIVAV